MIDLTPLDVRKKKGDFKRIMRGYDPALVDDFLDLAADRLEELVRQVMALEEKVERLERGDTEHRDREKALTEALVTAQEMRAEVRSQALREAELAKREAEQDARRIRAEALEAKEREKDAIRRLQARRAQLVRSYRMVLEREVAELDVMARSLEVEDEVERQEERAPAAGSAAAVAAPAAPTFEPPQRQPEPEPAGPSDPSSFTDEEEDALIREMNAILAQQGRSAEPETGFEPESDAESEVELFLSDDDVVTGAPSFLEEESPAEDPFGLTLRGDEKAQQPESARSEGDEADDDSDDLLSRMFEH